MSGRAMRIGIALLMGFIANIANGECAPAFNSEGIGNADSLQREFSNAKARNLKELVVKPKRRKYSKKNNPAVELMHRIQSGHKKTDPDGMPYYSFNRYDKIVVAINELTTDFENSNGVIDRQLRFLNQFVDTAAWTGKKILNFSLKEKFSKVLGGEKISGKFEIIEGISSHGVDDAFNKENVRKVLEDLVQEVDIYSNDITLLQNRFVSPLSAIAADFYKFEITDTVRIGNGNFVELSFAPHNPQSMGFNGKIFVGEENGKVYVRRISMRLPKAANVNYIENMFVSQNFELDSIGKLHKTLDDVCVEFMVLPKTPKIYANRVSSYTGFSYGQIPEYSDYAHMKGKEHKLEDAEGKPDSYWESRRHVPLTAAQSRMGSMMNEFRKKPLFFWVEKVLEVLVQGYIHTSTPSKFDIGPVNTSFSYNAAEGFRMRTGGMTTVALSPRLFTRGYLAYGFRDRKLKYSGEVEYSFIDKETTPREFPVNSLRATYTYDIDELGQHYLFTNPDNVFLSFTRKDCDLITYRREAKLEYNREYLNNFSFSVQLRNERQEATSWVPFRYADGRCASHFIQSFVRLQLRFAPGEKFIQGNTNRNPINMDAPVFMLMHEFGPKGFLGTDFTINKTELFIQKRFWLSAFGYTDIIFKSGIIWSQVQFPALLWQNANLSYTIQPESYSLLNPMEFAMDKYASLDFSYFMNGLIFNRIPLVKKLKLREVLTFKGFYGALSRKNNPEFNPDLYQFALGANTTPMGKKPYMEIGAGIDNILTILRVDYVWRLTYRKQPGIDRRGLRISLHFSF